MPPHNRRPPPSRRAPERQRRPVDERRYRPDLVPAPDLSGQPNWLEVELGARLPKARRRRDARWHGRVPLGDTAEIRIKEGFRAAVQELENGSFLVNLLPDKTVTSGEVDVGVLPAMMVANALRNLLPQKKAAEKSAKKRGIKLDLNRLLDAATTTDDDDGDDDEGYGCRGQACRCGR